MSQNDTPYLNQPAAGGNLKTIPDNLVRSHLTGMGPSMLVRVTA